jgi:hypothetical protein
VERDSAVTSSRLSRSVFCFAGAPPISVPLATHSPKCVKQIFWGGDE